MHDIPEHSGMDDWRVTLIDRAEKRKELKKWESVWQYKLNTFLPHELTDGAYQHNKSRIYQFNFDIV